MDKPADPSCALPQKIKKAPPKNINKTLVHGP